MTETAVTPNAMQNDAILQKTTELCETIVSHPVFQSIRQRVETFMANEEAQTQYQQLMEKGQTLQQKQQMGLPLDNEEIGDFERSREQLIGNAIARDFLDAQEEMRRVQESVTRYVNKTFEIGRVPGPDDFTSCGHGCSCH